MREVVSTSPATYNHLVIDACHSYFMVEPRGERGERRTFDSVLRSYLDREALAAHPNTGVVVSTSSRAEVHEWSLVRAGMSVIRCDLRWLVARTSNNDGQVSYDEIAAFLAAANQEIADSKDSNCRLHQATGGQ